MLYNQHLESISTTMSVGPQHLSTPPYTPHSLQSSIKTLISTPLLPPPKIDRAHNGRRPSIELQGSSKLGIQDTLVLQICLRRWGGRLFLKGDRRLHALIVLGKNNCPYWLVVWTICRNFMLCFLLVALYASTRTPSEGTCAKP